MAGILIKIQCVAKSMIFPCFSRSFWKKAIALLFAVSALSGCVSDPIETPIDRTISDELSRHQESKNKTLPSAVADAMVPGGDSNYQTIVEERFDLAVRNAPAKAFFLGLVEGTDTNVVVHPEVTGKVTLELNDVTVEDVLSVTRDIYGYEFKKNRGIYTIYPSQLRTEVFHIDYLDVQRVGVSDTSVLIGQFESSSNSNNGDSGSSNNSSGSGGANLLGYINDSGSDSAGIVPGSRVQTLNKTDFWSSLERAVSAIIGGSRDNRMVMVTPQAGMVIVKAMPNELNSVRNFLERSELSVKRQVILETKILEVELIDEFNAGIDWTAISGQLLYTNNVAEFAEAAITTTAANGDLFSSLLKVNDIQQLLSLLQTQGSVQVLSSPRISTVNNQKAVIRVGQDEYFVTGISSNTTSNASSTTNNPNIDLAPFFSGIALDVTPQIADDGDVILHIHPVVSDITDQIKNLTVGDSQFSLPLALREVRESDSIVRAQSGDVVVLGGLMQERMKDIRKKTPGPGDVPLVDTFFKQTERSTVKTELVILLRPIVVDDDSMEDDLSRTKDRFQSLNREYRAFFNDVGEEVSETETPTETEAASQ